MLAFLFFSWDSHHVRERMSIFHELCLNFVILCARRPSEPQWKSHFLHEAFTQSHLLKGQTFHILWLHCTVSSLFSFLLPKSVFVFWEGRSCFSFFVLFCFAHSFSFWQWLAYDQFLVVTCLIMPESQIYILNRSNNTCTPFRGVGNIKDNACKAFITLPALW